MVIYDILIIGWCVVMSSKKISNKDIIVEIEHYNNLIQEIKKEYGWDKIGGCYNKSTGNVIASILRKYIKKYCNKKYKVSNVNSYIEGCPIEWDLIILKKDAVDNYINTYRLDDCVCLIEFKTSGLWAYQVKQIDKTFDLHFKYLYNFREKLGRSIPFAYITYSETISYYEETKKYFDKMNGINNTTFMFKKYNSSKNNQNYDFEVGYSDFEKYIMDLLR